MPVLLLNGRLRRVRVACAWGGASFTAHHCVRFSGSKNRIHVLGYRPTVSWFNEFVTLDQCNVCVDLDELPAA